MRRLLLILVLLSGCSTVEVPLWSGKWTEGEGAHWNFREAGTFEAIRVKSDNRLGVKRTSRIRGVCYFGVTPIADYYRFAYISEVSEETIYREESLDMSITYFSPEAFTEFGTFTIEGGNLILNSNNGRIRTLYRQ